MSHIFVRNERIIDAKPEEVYETLTDYKNKRPRMLTPNFLDYMVEKGGQGDGTGRHVLAGQEVRAGQGWHPRREGVARGAGGRVLANADRRVEEPCVGDRFACCVVRVVTVHVAPLIGHGLEDRGKLPRVRVRGVDRRP